MQTCRDMWADTVTRKMSKNKLGAMTEESNHEK